MTENVTNRECLDMSLCVFMSGVIYGKSQDRKTEEHVVSFWRDF